jgi:hypothetical protein
MSSHNCVMFLDVLLHYNIIHILLTHSLTDLFFKFIGILTLGSLDFGL